MIVIKDAFISLCVCLCGVKLARLFYLYNRKLLQVQMSSEGLCDC